MGLYEHMTITLTSWPKPWSSRLETRAKEFTLYASLVPNKVQGKVKATWVMLGLVTLTATQTGCLPRWLRQEHTV
jgi:hypothetical protein